MGKQKDARQREKLRRQRDRRKVEPHRTHSKISTGILDVEPAPKSYFQANKPQLRREDPALNSPVATAYQIASQQLDPSMLGITAQPAVRNEMTEPERIGRTMYNIRRNLSNRLRKNSDPSVTRYQCSQFDINSIILQAPKAQPPENSNSKFEVENESKLKLLTGDVIVVTDKNGIPCVIKASGRKTLPFAEEKANAMEEYAAIYGHEVDQVRHGNSGTRYRNSGTANAPPAMTSFAPNNPTNFRIPDQPKAEAKQYEPASFGHSIPCTKNLFTRCSPSTYMSADSSNNTSSFVPSERFANIPDDDLLPKTKRLASYTSVPEMEVTPEPNTLESITLCPPINVLLALSPSSSNSVTSTANSNKRRDTYNNQVGDTAYPDRDIEKKLFPATSSHPNPLHTQRDIRKRTVSVVKPSADFEDLVDTSSLSSKGKKRKREDNSGEMGGGGSINIHRAFAARLQKKTCDIEIGPGPAPSFGTKKAVQGLRTFATRIKPLTRLVETLFRTVLPTEYDIYQQAYLQTFNHDPDPVDSAFGLWTSRALVLNATTNAHRDLHDVCRGFCALTPFGVFDGGNACFPQLGIKLECGTGSVLFLRSYPLIHYVGAYTGRRLSLVHYTHQSVHDNFVERTGVGLWEFEKMPYWWQKSRQHLRTLSPAIG